MIYILSWTTTNIKNSFQATTFKVEENSRTFQGLPLEFKDFPRSCEPWNGLGHYMKSYMKNILSKNHNHLFDDFI